MRTGPSPCRAHARSRLDLVRPFVAAAHSATLIPGHPDRHPYRERGENPPPERVGAVTKSTAASRQCGLSRLKPLLASVRCGQYDIAVDQRSRPALGQHRHLYRGQLVAGPGRLLGGQENALLADLTSRRVASFDAIQAPNDRDDAAIGLP